MFAWSAFLICPSYCTSKNFIQEVIFVNQTTEKKIWYAGTVVMHVKMVLAKQGHVNKHQYLIFQEVFCLLYKCNNTKKNDNR